MNISVYYCFPRSGGTLLNQCLLCHDQNVVLSEINPADSVIHPADQARDWFNLISDRAGTSRMNDLFYNDAIHEISETCAGQGKHLCLRDWSGPNFVPGLSPWVDQPSLQLEQKIYLQYSKLKFQEIVFLRRSRAVFDSLRKNIPECAHFTIRHFEAAYRPFVTLTQGMDRFFLEDFIKNSPAQLKAICSRLGLGFAPDFSGRFARQTKLTGNTTLPKPAPSSTWTEIKAPALPREESHPHPVFEELDLLAGYVD